MSSSSSSRYRESAAVTAPSKVHDQSHSTSFAEEHALDAIAKEAELRLQHQREQNREARQLRHKELEKNARDDDGGDSTTAPLTPSTPMGSSRSRIMSLDGTNNNVMTAASANSLLLQKFLNGDVDLRSIDQRDIRRLLSELEAKYKASMIANSSMYNEKQALRYQVDTFKDTLDEYLESLNQAKRQLKEKCKDFDLQKRTLTDLQKDHALLKEVLASREKLIEESGMQLISIEECNGENSEHRPISTNVSSVLPTGLISQQTSQLLNSLGKGSIDEKLKRILIEKREHFEQIVKLKSDLEEERSRARLLEKQMPKLNDHNVNGSAESAGEQQKQLMREMTEIKNRLQRLEAENVSLQQENKRYEAQLKRHKQQTDDAERVEEDLKQERRRLQRELRVAREELESERTRSDVLQRENERLRTLRKKNLLNSTTDEPLIASSAMISRSHTNSPLPPLVYSSSSPASSSNSTSAEFQFTPSTQDPT